ncbi:hypothetical protein E2C01_035937 [Portunus trituberculatus]|uniref:Uncharacterized protein n=1 Tax=Portunus trituberculatus TaxID=210409 RepID=A0A5B7FB22_PORTR|nr:hypothetical protein [Portunus trituberculatus]
MAETCGMHASPYHGTHTSCTSLPSSCHTLTLDTRVEIGENTENNECGASAGHVSQLLIFPNPNVPSSNEMAEVLDKVADVDIDEGTFKYVLIKVHHSPTAPAQETSKYIVRG